MGVGSFFHSAVILSDNPPSTVKGGARDGIRYAAAAGMVRSR
jgi:hypothetical protein